LLGVGARLRNDSLQDSARFGFVVSRRVGKATVRNRVKRRLRAIAREISGTFTGWDVVVTAKPPAGDASFAELSQAMSTAIRRATHLASTTAAERIR